MAVFENLRNFIRHGKQAAAGGGNQPLINNPAIVIEHDTDSDLGHHLDSRGSVSEPNLAVQERKEAYNDAVKQIIAEENEERSRIRTYPGLERFELIEKMGDGAFSVVYKAYDRINQNYVAIKVIHKQELSSSQVSTQHNPRSGPTGLGRAQPPEAKKKKKGRRSECSYCFRKTAI